MLVLCRVVFAQEWTADLGLSDGILRDLVAVDKGDSALGVGTSRENGIPDGFVVKIGKDGGYSFREVHLPGMMLEYFTAVQLEDGNYMVFGICEDSLWNLTYPRYLRVDVFDSQLGSIDSRTYCVDDEVFDCFVDGLDCLPMQALRSRQGTTLLGTLLSYYVEQPGYYTQRLRFYEFDDNGDIVRIVDNLDGNSAASSIEEITYEPHSDNLLVAVGGGVFPPNSGLPGVYVVDSSLNIVARQDMVHIQGGVSPYIDAIERITCDGRWTDDGCMVVGAEILLQQRFTFTYHTLYKLDSALNVHAELRLPPYDSCMYCPSGTSTAYINDSTVFAFTDCSRYAGSTDILQANVYLVDGHLNLLGRKTIREDGVYSYFGPPTVFSDGGCVVPFYSCNSDNYQGEPFFKTELMKFRREDIEISWDVVKENEPQPTASAYPNPTRGNVNIPIGEASLSNARLQIFDMRGRKCLDCALNGQGNLVTLDVQNLETGMYIYQITDVNKVITNGTIIKE